MGIWARNKSAVNEFGFIESALQEIKHRGPDNLSHKVYSKFALAHARLSVIELSDSANQPFSSEDGRFHLIFNGEIYNYKELRNYLSESEVVFKTNSDTEVLFQLLIREGKNCLNKLNGFFSFMFVDSEKEEVIAARDRFGIKPLLYFVNEEKLIVASELKPFFHFNLSKNISDDSLSQYFKYTYTVAPSTILNDVKKLLPGQLIQIRNNEVKIESFYTNKITDQKISLDRTKAKAKLKDLLYQSVQRRLIADVPVGCFLSGGVDSSIISAVAKDLKSDIKTFSIGFDHPYFNEADHALKIAKHIGTEHHELVLTKKDFQEEFYNYLNALDEPFADSSSFAFYLLSKFAKSHVTVALSGDGADELFGGYRKHRAEALIKEASGLKKMSIKAGGKIAGVFSDSRSSKLGDLTRKLKKLSHLVSLSSAERYDFSCAWMDEKLRKELLLNQIDVQNASLQKNLDINDYLLADQNFVLPNDMLKKVDQMSMAFALEVRVPFLDHELVEFANSLSADLKVNAKNSKIILKETFADKLLPEIIKRPKHGFEIPLAVWLGDELSDFLDAEIFERNFITDQKIFNWNFIDQIKKEWKSGVKGERVYLIWALIVFQNWYKKVWLKNQ